MSNWFGTLETGLQHDDYRFRRAVYVHAGMGFGHSHDDSLDLQVFATRIADDRGWRPAGRGLFGAQGQ